jgi:hypothetical protein
MEILPLFTTKYELLKSLYLNSFEWLHFPYFKLSVKAENIAEKRVCGKLWDNFFNLIVRCVLKGVELFF